MRVVGDTHEKVGLVDGTLVEEVRGSGSGESFHGEGCVAVVVGVGGGVQMYEDIYGSRGSDRCTRAEEWTRDSWIARCRRPRVFDVQVPRASLSQRYVDRVLGTPGANGGVRL